MKTLKRKYPDINMRTPLKNIPKEWLDEIEPNIRRDVDGCWNWTRGVTHRGYPRMQYYDFERGGYYHMPAHVRAAMIFWEFDRAHYAVRRSCRNPLCVRPSHLRPVYFHWTQKSS